MIVSKNCFDCRAVVIVPEVQSLCLSRSFSHDRCVCESEALYPRCVHVLQHTVLRDSLAYKCVNDHQPMCSCVLLNFLTATVVIAT